jgi:hypothetical protein
MTEDTQEKVRAGCTHTDVTEGPRVPAMWGSWPTQVCTACGATRTNGHVPGPWMDRMKMPKAER